MARARERAVFVCNACGDESLRWEGRCPGCGEWNTLVEAKRSSREPSSGAWVAGANSAPQELAQVAADAVPRLRLSSPEVNRVLGGGLVPGSLTLIAGDPGIGKSTLLLRLAADVSDAHGNTLYVCGEESASQIKMRADRLGISGEGLYVLPSTDLDQVLRYLDETKPSLAVVDSIQTLNDQSLPAGAGTIAQIRECTRRLIEWVKEHEVPLVLSGHVTKGGDIAGPRVLEHMVDAVLYMEGDPISSWRLLRTVKNRFGSTNEVGVLEMTSRGLIDVEDPSRAFLSERRVGAIGSVIVATMEGSRPLLAEIQALTTPSSLPTPRRVATGLDLNRLLLVCAVLTRRVGMRLADQDIVVNVAGGLRIREPAADLGLALALASSVRNAPVEGSAAAIGEIGLSGEVRRVPQIGRRIQEVGRLGLQRCLVPSSARDEWKDVHEVQPIPVETLAEAIQICVPRGNRAQPAVL